MLEKTQKAADIVKNLGALKKTADEQWGDIYRDPLKASHSFEAYRAKHGHDQALRKMASRPNKFGKMRGGILLESNDRQKANQAHRNFIASYRDYRKLARGRSQLDLLQKSGESLLTRV